MISLALILISLLLPGFPGMAADGIQFTEDADAIEAAADSVFMLEVFDSSNQRIGTGSGFAAIAPQILVTNYHVIEGGAYVIAVSDDNQRYVVDRLCAADRANDIAVLRFSEPNGVAPLEMDGESELKRAQAVVAIGSPAGLKNTVSLGNISAFYREGKRDWIQFTAPISAGSSGGALLNDAGKVIGITTATYASTQNVNMAVRAGAVISLYDRWDGYTLTGFDGRGGRPVQVALNNPGGAENEAATVYVGKSGKKYHNNPHCSNMTSATEMELLQAIEKGYEPCGKCYK